VTADYVLRSARAADLAPVRALLEGASLPTDGVEDQFGDGFVVAECEGAIVGVEGIERYESFGLLRSAAVSPAWRGRGVGDVMTRDRIRWARMQGLESLWLLTTTADAYFTRYGFERAERAAAPDAMQRSREFVSACPASAVAMRLDLSISDDSSAA
jgi:amino-acid N-acetyltransferase